MKLRVQGAGAKFSASVPMTSHIQMTSRVKKAAAPASPEPLQMFASAKSDQSSTTTISVGWPPLEMDAACASASLPLSDIAQAFKASMLGKVTSEIM